MTHLCVCCLVASALHATATFHPARARQQVHPKFLPETCRNDHGFHTLEPKMSHAVSAALACNLRGPCHSCTPDAGSAAQRAPGFNWCIWKSHGHQDAKAFGATMSCKT